MGNFVLIIVLNYNQNKYTLDCINSILSSDYKCFKILLIDNGSTKENRDNLVATLPNDKNLIFKQIDDNIGYVGGMNFGFKEGSILNPDYFLVMNNDSIIDIKAIKELVETCKNYNNKAIVTGKVYHFDEPQKLQDIGHVLTDKKYLKFRRLGVDEIDNGQYDKIEERDIIDDVFGLYPIDLYKKIGGYSSYFWFNGEVADLLLRAKNENYKLVFTPFAKLWHKGSVSIGGREMNPKLAYWSVQSALIFRYLHLRKMRFLLYYLLTIKGILRTFLKAIYIFLIKKENHFKYALAKYKGLVYFNKWIFKKNENTGYNPF